MRIVWSNTAALGSEIELKASKHRAFPPSSQTMSAHKAVRFSPYSTRQRQKASQMDAIHQPEAELEVKLDETYYRAFFAQVNHAERIIGEQ